MYSYIDLEPKTYGTETKLTDCHPYSHPQRPNLSTLDTPVVDTWVYLSLDPQVNQNVPPNLYVDLDSDALLEVLMDCCLKCSWDLLVRMPVFDVYVSFVCKDRVDCIPSKV